MTWFLVAILAIFAFSVVTLAFVPSGVETGQINVEFFFRQLYELWGRLLGLDLSGLPAELSVWWYWIGVVGYLASFLGFIVLIYVTMRLFQLRKIEHEEFATLVTAPAKAKVNQRFKHIESLMESTSPNDWRQAIIEADIMLDDALTQAGYHGADLGEKLKSVNRSKLQSLDEAWEAHKVRNQIAHQGSAFDLSPSLAKRTLGRYQSVFRELGIL